MKARVKWIEGVAFLGESGSGHGVVLDGALESGGRNLGIRPRADAIWASGPWRRC